MSRSLGPVAAAILELVRGGCRSAPGSTVTAAARHVYGVDPPTQAQRESVRHCFHDLAARGLVETRRGHGEPYRQETRRASLLLEPCSGTNGCRPCRYGNRRRRALGEYEQLIREYRGEPGVEQARRHGFHVWSDYTPAGLERGTGRTRPRIELFAAARGD